MPKEMPGGFDFNQLPETALNLTENICAIICRPIEIILRPWHGSRYFRVHIVFFSSLMMVFLPFVATFGTGMLRILPFVHPIAPLGLFGIVGFSKLYFLLTFIHSIRIYRRMVDMSREHHSEFEGPALPFFRLFPKSESFWITRIVLESIFVFICASILGHFFILEPGLVHFLQFAALAMAMKNFVGWYRAWEYLRVLMDTTFMGPIIARLAKNEATESELASIHVAGFPKNISQDIRKSAAAHIARVLSINNQNPSDSPKERP